LADKRQAEAESKEKNLQQRLQAALDSLRGKFLPCLNKSLASLFLPSFWLIQNLHFVKLLPNWG
jgi:hypothetical protein